MLINKNIAFIALTLLCACASTKSTNKGIVAQSSTSVDTQANTNKYKADFSKLPTKSTHEILYDK